MNPLSSILSLTGALCLAGGTGCSIESKCYSDADCPSPEICKEEKCVFECNLDEDCIDDFGVEFVCDENHCRYPQACVTCSFPNADASCVHGDCKMEGCHDGFHDLNEEPDDGCEYACTRSNDGVEACDLKDNDCDGETDEGFDLDSDVENCGECGNICPERPHSDPVCASGRCGIQCHDGWFDNNEQPEDGCEAPACVPTEEVCDGRDNDCDCPGDTNDDGVVCGPGDEGVDEGFDKTLPETCGDYCEMCEFVHAEPLCVDGECRPGACDDGWYDANGVESDGCECSLTNEGVEICDGIDNDCDGQVDEGGVCGLDCPEDMVPVGSDFCIDRYEASRPDATELDAGTDETVATSRPGVLPWMVNPMTYDHFLSFQAACQAAGKRLCTKEEWYASCTGPAPGTTYVFGDDFDQEVCNCVDTFCDDYCADNGIPPEQCNTGSNCGYEYYCFHEMPTASFPGCTNEYGTLDITGNVWEVVPSEDDPRGYEIRGGAFNCGSPATRLECSFNAGWEQLFAGFRCCLRP